MLLTSSTYYLLWLTYRAQRLNSSASTAYYLLNSPPSVYVSISNFACAIPLNCDAKVVLLFVSCKQIGEKVCFINFRWLKCLFVYIF